MTTGASASTSASRGSGASSRTRRDTGETKRKRTRKTSGAAPRTEHPRRPRARVEKRGRGADGGRDGHEHERRRVHAPDDLKDDQGDEPADEHEVEDGRGQAVREAGERLQREQHERRDDDQPDGEEHDLPAGRAADREELDIAGEEVEDGLRDRDGAQAGEVQAGLLERAGRVGRTDLHGRESGFPTGACPGARRASSLRARSNVSVS